MDHGLVCGLDGFRIKKKEQRVQTLLQDVFSNVKSNVYLNLRNNDISSKSCMYIDFVVPFGDRAVCIEVDEHQHSTYDEKEEWCRMKAGADELQHKHIVWIRYNPDTCRKDSQRYYGQKEKEAFLMSRIRANQKNGTVEYLFYKNRKIYQESLE